jgi:thymidylate kinase
MRQDLAQQLFDFFGAESIPYVIVGDTRRYGEVIDSDVDIVVSHEAVQNIPEKLREFCRRKGAKVVQVLQHEQTAWYFVLAWQDGAGQILFLHLDICSDYYRNGKLFLRASELLQDPVGSRDGFYVPTPAKAFIYYLLKKIDKGHLDERQFNYLKLMWNDDSEGAIQQVRRFWPEKHAQLIADAFKDGNYESIRSCLSALQKAIHAGLAFSPKAWSNELLRKMKRGAEPTGIFVVFLGPDGSGKSTVISEVEKSLAPAFRRTRRYHLRPHVGARAHNGAPVTDPHGKPSRGLIASLSKLALWWTDYSIGYISDVYPRLARSTLVIFDRYCDDLLVDPKRYRYGAPLWMAKLVTKAVPRPNLVILLDAPAEVLRARKQEVPFEEAVRQRESYVALAHDLSNGYLVDASQPIEQVVANVEDIILRYLANRTARRLGFAG